MRLTFAEFAALASAYVDTPVRRIPESTPASVCDGLHDAGLATETGVLTRAGEDFASQVIGSGGHVSIPGRIPCAMECSWKPVRAGFLGWMSFDGEQLYDPLGRERNTVRVTRAVAEEISRALLADQERRMAAEGEYTDYVPTWQGEELWLHLTMPPGEEPDPGWRVGPDEQGYYVLGGTRWQWDAIEPRDDHSR
ncbi:hypothetical protein CLV63_11237 [Murinocardiopsis flavida]|uniref:Uncharacterized protein n=1 Tax=Murinocardiopsis flavida TaxID=645275 RepID=A0A2P8DG10_9ACTN|nr:hypothetical protein [Murinocardiopsis flavida]PSK96155.1 hypothetical protein CLV63_11237 [Murinocardiopsis flavida]